MADTSPALKDTAMTSASAIENTPAEITGTALTPMDMLHQAIGSGANVEIMEKLLSLHERWEAGQARKAFDHAMADLRANLPGIVKTQEGYGYKYEDLSQIVSKVAPVMADRGLSFRWNTSSNGEVSVTCIITHRDGHSEQTTLSAKPDTSGSKNAIQAIGSAVTYLQRYTLKAALGIAAAHDDDGNSAAPRGDQKPVQPKPKAQSRETFDRLVKAIRAAESIDVLEKLWNHPKTGEAFESLPDDWQDNVQTEYADKKREFNGGIE